MVSHLCILRSWTHPNGCKYEGSWPNDMYDGTGQYSVRNTVLYNGQWSFGKMNGHGSFFFADGGKCTCSQWVDDFFPDNTSGERMFPDGQPCNLKATDFKDKKSARFRRRWEDGVFYENGWRSVC